MDKRGANNDAAYVNIFGVPFTFLLHDRGPCFVQIGDENLRHARDSRSTHDGPWTIAAPDPS